MTRGRVGGARLVLGGAGLLSPCGLLAATPASAHAFGARYDLPLPLDIYLVGAGLVVFLIFVASVVLMRPGAPGTGRWWVEMRAGPFSRTIFASVRWFLLGFGLFLFCLVLATALIGNDSPTRNFAPPFVWVIWWVGLPYVAALIADCWPWLSPWRLLLQVQESLLGRLGWRARISYPAALDYWPAVALFFVFAWIELVSDAGESPRTLGLLILAYTVLTSLGGAVYGAGPWRRHGEAFAVFYGVLGRFAPLHFSRDRLRLRIVGAGLLEDRETTTALMVFVVLMLSTVTFDGFVETPAWSGILDWIVADMTLRPMLLALRDSGLDLLAAIKTCALLAAPMLFVGVYLVFCRLIGLMSGSSLSTLRIGRAFVFSLVPIAIAYHLAHYYSYLLLAGQLIIPLISDPFGFGWNLFGTANRTIDITVVNAKTTWYVAVTSIVLGHVIAVLLGHVMALRLFETRRAAVLSQIPMTVLMVGYTMISLWILSQPIVESPAL